MDTPFGRPNLGAKIELSRHPLVPADEFAREDIGYLTKPIAVREWIETVRDRYGFLRDMTDEEQRWAQCNARHDREVSQALRALSGSHCHTTTSEVCGPGRRSTSAPETLGARLRRPEVISRHERK